MGLFAIDFMPNMGDRIIDRFTHAVDPAQRPMLGDRVPGREREVLAERPLFGRGERLNWDRDPGHRDEGRVFFAPFDCGIFNGHFRGKLAELDQKVKACVALGEMVLHIFAQEIRGGGLDEGRDAAAGARGELHLGFTEAIRCRAPISGIQRVANLRTPDCVGDSEFVQPEINRIKTGKKNLRGLSSKRSSGIQRSLPRSARRKRGG